MQKLLIKGKRELSGKISISGSKNASLPILAASILAREVRLKNIPLVKDIFTMSELLKFIGLKVNIFNNKNSIKVENTNKTINTLAPYKLVKTMRAGVLVLGPLLAKYKKAKISLPGGCAIGSRPVDLHLFALKKLGYKQIPVTLLDYDSDQIKTDYVEKITKNQIVEYGVAGKLLTPKSTRHVFYSSSSKNWEPIILLSSLFKLKGSKNL